MHPRLTPCCSGLPQRCVSVRYCSSTALQRWRAHGTMPSSRGLLSLLTSGVTFMCYDTSRKTMTPDQWTTYD